MADATDSKSVEVTRRGSSPLSRTISKYRRDTLITTQLRFTNVGNSTVVCSTRVMFVVKSSTSPSKRILARAKREGKYIDACMGRPCKSLIITDIDTVVGTIYKPETILKRLNSYDDSYIEMDETVDEDGISEDFEEDEDN